jgi:uncharacterized membrane protein
MAIAALSLVGIFLAAYLSMSHLGLVQLACGTSSECDQVNTSEWAKLAGIPVAYYGFGFYVTSFIVSMLGLQPRYSRSPLVSKLLLYMSAFGVLFSAWLTYLELFVIHAICRYCVVSAIVVVILFVLSWMDHRARKAEPA